MRLSTYDMCINALRSKGPLGVNAISELIGRCRKHVQDMLAKAAKAGVVTARRAGRGFLYELTGKAYSPKRHIKSGIPTVLFATDGMAWIFPSARRVGIMKRVSTTSVIGAVKNGYKLKGERVSYLHEVRT